MLYCVILCYTVVIYIYKILYYNDIKYKTSFHLYVNLILLDSWETMYVLLFRIFDVMTMKRNVSQVSTRRSSWPSYEQITLLFSPWLPFHGNCPKVAAKDRAARKKLQRRHAERQRKSGARFPTSGSRLARKLQKRLQPIRTAGSRTVRT